MILPIALNPANLARMEEKYDKGTVTGHIGNEHAAVELTKEIEDIPPGNSSKNKVLLDSSRYVLFCNVPEHYDNKMYPRFM